MNTKIIKIDLNGVNSYLLKNEDSFILVDTGGHIVMDKNFTNRLDLLEQSLEKHGCTSKNLKLILLTHGHNDHVCNAAFLRGKYHTKIAIHKDDCYLVQNLTIKDYMDSFIYRSFIYKIFFQCMRGTINKVAVKIVDDFKPFCPDIIIDENFKLSDYGFDGEIIHIPGHTYGSIAVLLNDGDLIAGDLFANMKKPEITANALDFKMLGNSINQLKSLHQINTVYPGHGKPFDL